MLELGNSDSIILSAIFTAYNNLSKKNSTYQFHDLIHWGIVVTVSSVYRPRPLIGPYYRIITLKLTNHLSLTYSVKLCNEEHN